jgi:hypothetical protein
VRTNVGAAVVSQDNVGEVVGASVGELVGVAVVGAEGGETAAGGDAGFSSLAATSALTWGDESSFPPWRCVGIDLLG